MSFWETVSRGVETAWFHVRCTVLRWRAARYRRFAMYDEVKIGDDLVIRRERRDMAFEKKVSEFNKKYKKMAPEGAVGMSLSLHPNKIGDSEPRHRRVFFTFFSFEFKDTLTVQKGNRKVVVDRTGGLAVYGSMKASLLEGEVGDFYRQTQLSVELAKKSMNNEDMETPQKPVEPKGSTVAGGEQKKVGVVLDPEAVAREYDIFIGNVDKIEKAINSGTDDEPLVLEPYEEALVEHLHACQDCKATRQDLQSLLTPYRKRVAMAVNSVNEKCYDMLREPLIIQEDDHYQMNVSCYNIIFSDGR